MEAVGDICVGASGAYGRGFRRRSPQWWWPSDRSWFVASEIDDPWTYVGGPLELIDTIVANPGLDAIRLR